MLASVALVSSPVGGQLGPLGIAFVLVFVILSLGAHEAMHAWVALKCGDPTGRDLGRITLNPLPHIDPLLTVILPLASYLLVGMFFGGAKPVPVNVQRLRHPVRDMMLVALAGPVSNFLIAALFLVAWKVAVYLGDYDVEALLPQVLLQTAHWNLLLSAFNLLPLPPLDGSRVMAWILPAQLRPAFAALERWGLLIVLLVMQLVPGVSRLIFDLMNSMTSLIDFASGGAW